MNANFRNSILDGNTFQFPRLCCPHACYVSMDVGLFTQSANVCHKQHFRLNLNHAKFA